jgi:hypothetical protein
MDRYKSRKFTLCLLLVIIATASLWWGIFIDRTYQRSSLYSSLLLLMRGFVPSGSAG